jgi:hypothetical protein
LINKNKHYGKIYNWYQVFTTHYRTHLSAGWNIIVSSSIFYPAQKKKKDKGEEKCITSNHCILKENENTLQCICRGM